MPAIKGCRGCCTYRRSAIPYVTACPVLFELPGGEDEACVRAVLGHFVFVYNHPDIDGNGRVARFLMNVMLASGGYPWTVAPVDRRDDYLSAMESASIDRIIVPFAQCLASQVQDRLNGKASPAVPAG